EKTDNKRNHGNAQPCQDNRNIQWHKSDTTLLSQGKIDTLRQSGGNPFNRTQIINTGIHNARKPAKPGQEFLSSSGTNPLNLFQSRNSACFRPLGPHACNGKTVSL